LIKNSLDKEIEKLNITGLYHIGIYTKDIDISLKFYEDILEFTKEWRGVVDHPTGDVESAVLRLGDCVIELVKPVDLNRVTNIAGPVQHFALKVNGLEELMEAIETKGVTFSFEGLETITNFRNGIRHAFIFGPSNERIELVEEIG